MTFKRLLLLTFLVLGGCNAYDVSELKPVLRIDAPIEAVEPNDLVRFTDAKNNLMGLKDRKGNVVVPARYKMVDSCNKFGICDVWINDGGQTWCKINKYGKILRNSYLFDNGPDYFVAGLSRYVENGKLGFIDHKADAVIPARFDWASPFFFDAPVAVVCQGCKAAPDHGKGCCHSEIKGGKWGAIDRTGKIVIPLEFDRYTISKNNSVLFFKDSESYQMFRAPDGGYAAVLSPPPPPL